MANPALAAELLVAHTGLFPSDALEAKDGRAAAALPKAWADEISTLMTSERTTRAPRAPEISYLATWRKLVSRQNDDAAVSGISDPTIADAYKAKLVLARQYLRDRWGVLRLTPLAGPVMLEPGASAVQSATDLFALLNDAGRMVRLLRSGSLLTDELDAFQAVFPESFALLSALIETELVKQRARRKGYQVPYHAEVALRTFLGLPSGVPVTSIDKEAPTAPEPGPIETGGGGEAPKPHTTDMRTKADRVADIGPPTA